MADVDPPNRLQWGRQLELFGGEPAPAYGLDPDEMRAKLPRPSRGGPRGGDDAVAAADAKLYRLLFPQMTFWLPEEEGAQLRFEFETEMARLDAAA